MPRLGSSVSCPRAEPVAAWAGDRLGGRWCRPSATSPGIDSRSTSSGCAWPELTQGCGGGLFCPDAPVTRGQMASFLDRALELPPTTIDAFGDDNGTPTKTRSTGSQRRASQRLRPRPVLPDRNVSRGQMASFLARGLGLPLATRDWFGDDDRSAHQTNINRLAESRITTGCRPGRFCPGEVVTRGQMAAFLHRALTSSGPPEACTAVPRLERLEQARSTGCRWRRTRGR